MPYCPQTKAGGPEYLDSVAIKYLKNNNTRTGIYHNPGLASMVVILVRRRVNAVHVNNIAHAYVRLPYINIIRGILAYRVYGNNFTV